MDGLTVVYVGSYDRSGSTILDRLLGELPGCVSVGELRRIWDRGLQQNQLCGCGTPFLGCAYWADVLRTAWGASIDQQASRGRALAATVGRTRRYPGLLLGTTGARSQQLRAFGALLRSLYEAVARVSGSAVIVDSSKDPVYAAILRTIDDLDVRFVHLVRDARAVAFSQRRVREKPEIHWRRELRAVKSSWGTAVAWDVSAAMWRMLTRSAGGHLVRYEDLARDPHAVISTIVGSLGAEPSAGLDRLGAEVRLGTAHTVSGAAIRFHQGDLRVVPDLEWQEAMSPGDRGIVTALTWPWLRRFGYPVLASNGG